VQISNKKEVAFSIGISQSHLNHAFKGQWDKLPNSCVETLFNFSANQGINMLKERGYIIEL